MVSEHLLIQQVFGQQGCHIPSVSAGVLQASAGSERESMSKIRGRVVGEQIWSHTTVTHDICTFVNPSISMPGGKGTARSVAQGIGSETVFRKVFANSFVKIVMYGHTTHPHHLLIQRVLFKHGCHTPVVSASALPS